MSADAPPVLALSGAAQVRPPGRAPVRLERKQAALLAWLSLEGPTPRSRLAGLLWPDVPEARSRANLRQCLARLRDAAGALVHDSAGLLSLAPGVALAAPLSSDPPLLDADRFDDLAELSAWLESQRDVQRATRHRALLARVRAALQAGELDLALADADALLAADRESEEAYRTVMEVLYLRADHAAAIGVWDRCREMLRGLYGVSPSPATQHLGELLLKASAMAPAPLARVDALPATVMRPPRLIGRDAEMQALRQAWAAGSVLCVAGDAGLGKSRLLADFAASLGPHAAASARPGDSMLPYASLSRLLLAAIDRFKPALDGDDARAAGRLLPRLAALLPGAPPPPVQTGYERTQALLGLARLFGRCVAAGCVLFVFDDLQFADAQSTEALTVLAEPAEPTPSERRTPLSFALGTRPAEQPAGAAALLESLAATRRFMRIDLVPFDAAALLQLLCSLDIPGLDAGELAPRLRRHVGGNPAFVLESLKLLLSQGQLAATGPLPLPPGVREVIDRQFALLSEPARHLAQLAALAGSHHSLKLATEALACAPLQLAAPLNELATRQLFDGTRFSHDMVADAVRASLPPLVATFMHRLIAEHLERERAEPAAAASHWQAAGDHARAGTGFRAAAAAAEAASLPLAQSALLDLAAACFEQCGHADALFDVLAERFTISSAPDFLQRRLPLMERLEQLARSEEQRLRALQFRLGWRASQGHSDTIAEGRAAIERAHALGLPALAWGFVGPLSWQLAVGGEVDAALALIKRHGPWVESQPGRLLQAEYHATLAAVLGFADQLGASIHQQRLAAAAFRDAGQPVRCLPVLGNQGLMHHWRGELTQALAVLEEAAALRDRMQGRGSTLLIDVNRAAVLRDLGRCEEALSLLERAVTELRAGASGADRLAVADAVMAENHLAQTRLALGQPDAAAACLQTDDAGAAPNLQARRTVLRLRIARRLGCDLAPLRATARRQLGDQMPFYRRMLALELALSEPAEQALADYDDALADPVLEQRPGLQWHLALRRADALLALGRVAEARTVLAPWQAAPEGLQPYDIEPGEARLITGRVALAANDLKDIRP